jgi:sugar (pentulose or hexulose) kinase
MDLGTSGCRAVCIDENAGVLASASRALPGSRHPQQGWSEQDPEHWWQAVLEVLGELQSLTPDHQPLALSTDGTSGTLLLSNSRGEALSPGLMYDDRRAVAEADRLAAMAPEQAALHSPSSSLAKLLWLQAHGDIPSGAHALHQSEWISGKLCGNLTAGDENNCLKMGYDPVSQSWPAWMEALNLANGLLPRVHAVGAPLGEISPEIARRTGLHPDCRILAGTTDSTAAALATGLDRPGEALTSLGSTLVCKILVTRPIQSPEYGVYSHRIFGRWLAGGASNSGGAVLRRYFTDQEIRELSRQIDPRRSLCLEYYPLLSSGERFPVNDPGRQPGLHPVPKDRRRFLQGMLEGIARIEVRAYEKLESLGAGYPQEIATSGGGAVNEAWTAMRQRMLKRPVRMARHAQPAYGAALIARRGMRRKD